MIFKDTCQIKTKRTMERYEKHCSKTNIKTRVHLSRLHWPLESSKVCFCPRKGRILWILEKGNKSSFPTLRKKTWRLDLNIKSIQKRLKYVAFLHIVCNFCEHLKTLYVWIQTSNSGHCSNSSLLDIGVQPQHSFLPPTPKKNRTKLGQ